jgi:hypothetical protein
MPIILATWEAKIRRIVVLGHPPGCVCVYGGVFIRSHLGIMVHTCRPKTWVLDPILLQMAHRAPKFSGSKFIKQVSSDSADLSPKAEPQEQRGLSLYTI